MSNMTNREATKVAELMAFDNIEAWWEILDGGVSEEILNCLVNLKTPGQYTQVRIGLEDELKNEDIKSYAKAEYDEEQMKARRRCLKNGLNSEQISGYENNPEIDFEFFANALDSLGDLEKATLCANSRYDHFQRREIFSAFNDSFTCEAVKMFANVEFSAEQMREIKEGFEKGLNNKEILLYAKKEYECRQMEQIRLGLESLTQKQVMLYAKPEFTFHQMKQIRFGLEELNIEKVRLYAKKKFGEDQMEEIRKGLTNHLTIEEVKLYAKEKYNHLQMREIRKELESGLKKEQVAVYAKYVYNSSKMKYIRKCYEEIGFDIQQAKWLEKFNEQQISAILKGIKDGLGIRKINYFAKPEFDYDTMIKIETRCKNSDILDLAIPELLNKLTK